MFNAPTNPAIVITMEGDTLLVKPSKRAPLLKMHATRVRVKTLARFNAQAINVDVMLLAALLIPERYSTKMNVTLAHVWQIFSCRARTTPILAIASMEL